MTENELRILATTHKDDSPRARLVLRLFAERDALAARVADLEAALTPFAAMAACPGLTADDSVEVWPDMYVWSHRPATVRDIRRAAQVMNRIAPPESA